MASDIEELIIKVGIDVDTKGLEEIRAKIKEIQERTKNNSINLGLNTSTTSSSSPEKNAGKYLKEISESTKDLDKREIRKDRDKSKDIFPFVNEIKKLGIGGTIGAGVGGVIGAGSGSSFKIGAQVGSAAVSIVEEIVKTIYNATMKVEQLLSKKISEDLHFRELSIQSGVATNELYKLGAASRMVGMSQDKIIESNQRLSDELLGGISDQKAQLYQALGIDISAFMAQSNGDIGKLNTMIFNAINEKTKGQPAYLRQSFFSMAGYDINERAGRTLMQDPRIQKKAQELEDIATNKGKNIIGKDIANDAVNIKGGELVLEAQIRAALSNTDTATYLSTMMLDVQKDILSSVIKVLDFINPKTNNSDTINQNSFKKNPITQYDMLNPWNSANMHNNQNNVGKPDSSSSTLHKSAGTATTPQ